MPRTYKRKRDTQAYWEARLKKRLKKNRAFRWPEITMAKQSKWRGAGRGIVYGDGLPWAEKEKARQALLGGDGSFDRSRTPVRVDIDFAEWDAESIYAAASERVTEENIKAEAGKSVEQSFWRQLLEPEEDTDEALDNFPTNEGENEETRQSARKHIDRARGSSARRGKAARTRPEEGTVYSGDGRQIAGGIVAVTGAATPDSFWNTAENKEN